MLLFTHDNKNDKKHTIIANFYAVFGKKIAK